MNTTTHPFGNFVIVNKNKIMFATDSSCSVSGSCMNFQTSKSHLGLDLTINLSQTLSLFDTHGSLYPRLHLHCSRLVAHTLNISKHNEHQIRFWYDLRSSSDPSPHHLSQWLLVLFAIARNAIREPVWQGTHVEKINTNVQNKLWEQRVNFFGH